MFELSLFVLILFARWLSLSTCPSWRTIIVESPRDLHVLPLDPMLGIGGFQQSNTGSRDVNAENEECKNEHRTYVVHLM